MKMSEALRIIETREKGFMVHFEKRDRSILKADHFPDKHAKEDLIKTEDEAWDLASRFHKATDNSYVNIYVVDHEFVPVRYYEARKFRPLK